MKKNDPRTYSEANCWVVSAYHVLQYYADNKYPEMPQSTSKISYDPHNSEPRIYSKIYDKNGSNISGTVKNGEDIYYKWELRKSSFQFTELWAKTREYTNGKYGKINNGNIWQTENIVKNVAAQYGCKIKTTINFNWVDRCFDAEKTINRGDVFLWSTSNGTYGSHTMAGCGYRIYKMTVKHWFFTQTSYLMFFEIRDGWLKDPRYFDVSGHSFANALIFCEAK